MAFAGKVVLITGASSGIGAETAVHFSQLGAHLVLTGRNALKLNEVLSKCYMNNGGNALKLNEVLSKCYMNNAQKPLIIVADITKEADNVRIIENTIAHFGKLDVLVNNAGFAIVGGIETSTLADFDATMNTNLRSAYQLTKLAVPHLIKTKGNIVNVSSLAGVRSFTLALPYCISKAAMDQMTKCVALELAPKGVRVNSVNPATVKSNFLAVMGMDEDAIANFREKSKLTHPLGRIGTPLEVAKSIAFLADDNTASFITGTLLLVDGGRGTVCP